MSSRTPRSTRHLPCFRLSAHSGSRSSFCSQRSASLRACSARWSAHRAATTVLWEERPRLASGRRTMDRVILPPRLTQWILVALAILLLVTIDNRVRAGGPDGGVIDRCRQPRHAPARSLRSGRVGNHLLDLRPRVYFANHASHAISCSSDGVTEAGAAEDAAVAGAEYWLRDPVRRYIGTRFQCRVRGARRGEAHRRSDPADGDSTRRRVPLILFRKARATSPTCPCPFKSGLTARRSPAPIECAG